MDERIPRDPSDDRAAVFADLYATHYRRLVAVCRRLTGSVEGEELAQEAFLRAWSSWDRYAPGRPFWPWVSTIARRLCIDRGRRLRTAEARGPYAISQAGAAVATPEELFEANEEYRWARAALEQLRPDQRRVIRLRDVEGWSYDRIADHEGVTVESVRGSLRRARSRLRLVYARMSSGSPAVVLLMFIRDLRRRIAGWSHRVQSNAAAAGVFGARAAESVAALVVLAMGTASSPVAVAALPHALAAPRRQYGAITPTSVESTSTTSRSAPPMRDGGLGGTTGLPGAGSGAWGAVGGGGLQGPLGVNVPGSAGNTPESATFMSFTASPRYQQDREVYASGLSFQNCALTCPALFHSTDGGAHWARLPALGFEGGTVMLPPAYPADRRIFVGGANALKVSSDGGRTFTPLTPAGGYTAMSPGFSSGDGQILVGAIPGWIYHDGTKAVTPFDSVPESTSAALSFAYAPAYPRDHRIVVGGADASPSANAIVSACDVSKCTGPAVLPGSTGTPAVMASRSYSTSGLAFAWSADRLYRSTDGAASFSPLRLPAPGDVQALTEDAQGTLYLGLLFNGPNGPTGGLFASRDAGTTWTHLGAGTVLDHGVVAAIALPSGNLLVGPYARLGGGMQCSSDGGQTWAPRCP
ncbi:MAG: sigma-70 family RNA polymerase sigma factor [Acidimicrobiia bacterium]|nr:sigma-70 family RNA polymerase sigma factor [Acidimicrobiia bacterium]